MSNRVYTSKSMPFQDEASKVTNILSTHEQSRNISLVPNKFDADIIKGDFLELVINRFDKLTREINRNLTKTRNVEPLKRVSKIHKEKIQDVKTKKEKAKRKEKQQIVEKSDDNNKVAEISPDVQYEDLFRQISKINRRKNRRR